VKEAEMMYLRLFYFTPKPGVKMTDTASMLQGLMTSRQVLINVVTYEEDRVLTSIIAKALLGKNNQIKVPASISDKAGLLYRWSITEGLSSWRCLGNRSLEHLEDMGEETRDALEAIDIFVNTPFSGLLVLADVHAIMDDPQVVRKLKEASINIRRTKDSPQEKGNKKGHKNIILLSHKPVCPPEIEKSVAVLDVPMPDSEEIQRTLRRAFKQNPHLSKQWPEVKDNPEAFDRFVNGLQGLTSVEITSTIAQCISTHKRLEVSFFNKAKRQIIRKSGMLDFYDASGAQMGDIGGLEELKDWLKVRSSAFTQAARDYGLPIPKGMLLLGPPGTGKSLVSKTLGAGWDMPVLTLDMGRVYGSLVGESEANMRKAIQTAEALAPCILQVDEIEKAMGGSSNDGGTTQRVFGKFLTWMQDKTEPVFVVATANDVSKLPPEMLRKGRFDEIFFVDFPTPEEREAIFSIQLRKRKRDPANYDLKELSVASEGFSGAEIEQSIKSALYTSFSASRELKNSDILAEVSTTVPILKTMEKKIERVRLWALNRARFASSAQRAALVGKASTETVQEVTPEQIDAVFDFGGID